jgi:hypothetical protein
LQSLSQGLKLQHNSHRLNCNAFTTAYTTTNLFSPQLQHLSQHLNCNAFTPAYTTTNLFSPKLQHLSQHLNCNAFTPRLNTVTAFSYSVFNIFPPEAEEGAFTAARNYVRLSFLP